MRSEQHQQPTETCIRRLVLISAFRLSMVGDLLTPFLGTRCIRACDELAGAHTGDMPIAVVTPTLSATSTSPGARHRAVPPVACVNACPTGALFHKGATVGERHRDRDPLRCIATAQRHRQWLRDDPESPSL